MSSAGEGDIHHSVKRLKKGALWSLIGRVGVVLLTFMVNALIARIIDPNELGVYFLLLSVITLASTIGLIGMDRSAVRFVASSMGVDDSALCKKYITSMMMLAVLNCLLMVIFFRFFLAESIIRDFLESEALLGSLTWISLWALAMVLEVLIASVYRGFHDIRAAVFFSGLVRNTLMLIVLGWVFYNPNSSDVSLARIVFYSGVAVSVSALCGLLLLFFKLRNIGSSPESVLSGLLRTSMPLFVHALLLLLISQSNIWMLAAFCSKEDVALFGAAMRLVLLVGITTSVVNVVVAPLIAEKYAQGKLHSIESLIRAGTTVCGAAAAIVLLVFMFFAPFVLEVAFGEFYRQASVVLVVMSIGELVKVFTGPCSMALNMTGHQFDLMILTIIRAVVTISLSYYVAQKYGLVGVAIVYTASLFVNDLILMFVARLRLGIWTALGIKGIKQLLDN